jgi:hypothetical protein
VSLTGAASAFSALTPAAEGPKSIGPLGCGVASLQMNCENVVAADGAVGQAVPRQLLLFELFFFIGLLNFFDSGRER